MSDYEGSIEAIRPDAPLIFTARFAQEFSRTMAVAELASTFKPRDFSPIGISFSALISNLGEPITLS